MSSSTPSWMNLQMDDTYVFAGQWIDELVAEGYAGYYVLGNANGNVFEPRYVGRSDSDIHQELKAQEGKRRKDAYHNYKHFKFGLAESALAAFETECQLYHQSGSSGYLDNQVHPVRPKHTLWKCPVDGCHEFD
jgi:hypothetical protein